MSGLKLGVQDFLDLPTHLKIMLPFQSTGYWNSYCFSWLVLFLDLKQFLEACGLSGPNTTYSSKNYWQNRPQRPAKRAKQMQTSANLKSAQLEMLTSGPFSLLGQKLKNRAQTVCSSRKKASNKNKYQWKVQELSDSGRTRESLFGL